MKELRKLLFDVLAIWFWVWIIAMALGADTTLFVVGALLTAWEVIAAAIRGERSYWIGR